MALGWIQEKSVILWQRAIPLTVIRKWVQYDTQTYFVALSSVSLLEVPTGCMVTSKHCQLHYTIPLEALFLMITNSTVTVPTIPEISPTTTPPTTPTPTDVDEHSSKTGHVNSYPSVRNHKKLLILRYAQNVGGGCVVAKYSAPHMTTSYMHLVLQPCSRLCTPLKIFNYSYNTQEWN